MIQECGSGQSEVNGACCPTSMIYADPSGALQCCPQALLANGECVVLRDRPRCDPGFAVLADGSCCPASRVGGDGRTCLGQATPSTTPNFPVATCPNGERRTRAAIVLAEILPLCPNGRPPDARGNCPGPARPICPNGEPPDPRGHCAGEILPVCANGRPPDPRGRCEASSPIRCPPGETVGPSGGCVATERPTQPTIPRPSPGKPNVLPEVGRRPPRETFEPNGGLPQGVKPQIKRPEVTPPRIVGPRPSRPNPAPRPTPKGKRCNKERC